MVLYRCPKVYDRTLTALRASPQPSSSSEKFSLRASEEEKIVREEAKGVGCMQDDVGQRGRYGGDDQDGLAHSWFHGEGVCGLGVELEDESTAMMPYILANEAQQPDYYHELTSCSLDLGQVNGPASSQGHGRLISSVSERASWERSAIGCYGATDNRLSYCIHHNSEAQAEVSGFGPERVAKACDAGAVEIEATAPRLHSSCGVSVGDLQAKRAPAAMAFAEGIHHRNNDTIFSDSKPVMPSTLGSAEEPAELESSEVRFDIGHSEDTAWLGTADSVAESDALTWTEETCACLVEVMSRMQGERDSNDQYFHPGPSDGPIAMDRGTNNTEEINQAAVVEEQQGSVDPIVDTHVSSAVSALEASLPGSPLISRRASSIRPDSIAEGEALAEEHEKYVPYRLSMPRSSSAKLPNYTCYSPSPQHPARRVASSRSSFGKSKALP